MKTVTVVAALILRDGLIFAARRGPSQSHPNCWEFPGGKLEPGETPQEALARELHEELGIQGYACEFVQMRETRDTDRMICVHLYRTIIESDDFRLSEHSEAGWFTIEQARHMNWTQADEAFLDSVARVLETNRELYSATPHALDQIPSKAGGAHIFRAVQRPWDARDNPSYAIGHKCRMLLRTRFDCRALKVEHTIRADDGTTRIIFELVDGCHVETIHMPRDVKSPRVTLCISSQAGCAMGCAFCATAALGLRRNLTAGEIVLQVVTAIDLFGPRKSHAVNIVFMGMGEALMNTDNVLEAIDILAHERGLGIAPVRMTLSTSGVLDELPKLRRASNRPNLAISINATTNEVRDRIMPVNRRFPLEAIRKELAAWPCRHHEKILLEYVLLRDVNDSIQDAARLAEFARDLPHNINIIPYNETPRGAFLAPTQDAIQSFIKTLQDLGCFVTLRTARGVQVGGACGQLSAGILRQRTGEAGS